MEEALAEQHEDKGEVTKILKVPGPVKKSPLVFFALLKCNEFQRFTQSENNSGYARVPYLNPSPPPHPPTLNIRNDLQPSRHGPPCSPSPSRDGLVDGDLAAALARVDGGHAQVDAAGAGEVDVAAGPDVRDALVHVVEVCEVEDERVGGVVWHGDVEGFLCSAGVLVRVSATVFIIFSTRRGGGGRLHV